MEIKTFKVSGQQIKNQCYLAFQHNMGVLIDPAWDYHLINDFLLDNRITLKAVLLTHAHYDHTNLAAAFAQNKDVPVYMSEAEIIRTGFTCLNLIPAKHLEEFTIADFNIIPILTPGHTTGSTCYLMEQHLFSGDTVFIEGVGICDAVGVHQLFESVQLLKEYLPDHTLFWPGHSFGDDPGRELRFLLRNNIYFQLNKREQFINFRMRENGPNPFAFK